MKRPGYQSAKERRFDSLKASREAGRQALRKLLAGWHVDSLSDGQRTGLCVLLGFEAITKGTFVRLKQTPIFTHELGTLSIELWDRSETLTIERMRAALAPDFKPEPLTRRPWHVWDIGASAPATWYWDARAGLTMTAPSEPHEYPQWTGTEIKARQQSAELTMQAALQRLAAQLIQDAAEIYGPAS